MNCYESVTRSAEQQSDAAGTAAAAVEELNVSIHEVTRLANDSRLNLRLKFWPIVCEFQRA